MDKEKMIVYKGGITRSPSDFVCEEGELAECVNLTASEGGELKVMCAPEPEMSGGSVVTHTKKLVFVHRHGDGSECRIWDDGTSLYAGDSTIYGSGHSGKVVKSITALGNTLMVVFAAMASQQTGQGGTVFYFLWKGGTNYTSLSMVPSPKVSFYLSQNTDSEREGYALVKSTQKSGTDVLHNTEIVNGGQGKYNDMVVGLYAQNKKAVAQKKGFCEPFAARVALEFQDGTYSFISNPVLLWPTVTMNSHGQDMNQDFTLRTRYSQLYCKQETDYSDWGDVVKDVVLFVSDGVNIYDTSVDQPFVEYASGDYITDGICRRSGRSIYYRTQRDNGTAEGMRRWSVLQKRDQREILDDVKGLSLFYRLCSLGVKGMTGYINVAEKIGVHTLETLTTQERLKYDDYFSRNAMSADMLYVYNARLNLCGVRRGLFEGFGHFMPFDFTMGSATYDFYVTIKTPQGNYTVKHTEEDCEQMQGIYFYYPDPRATHVVIMKTSGANVDCVCNADLTEHPGLHGAYFMRGLPGAVIAAEVSVSGSAPGYNNDATESLDSQLVTSEVNNPFIFRASGYNRVGSGKILGMSTLTMALSQDNFGRTDLLLFSESGLWGLEVDGTGLFVSAHAVSRDVVSNVRSITQTDGAVLFVSKKGLMMVTEGGVSCVSERLDGMPFGTNGTPLAGNNISLGNLGQDITVCSDSEPFSSFLQKSGLMMAYDYIDNRMLLMDGVSAFCWVLSLKDGSFTKMPFAVIKRVVNAYPDYLLQTDETVSASAGPGKVYSLYNKAREELVSSRQRGFLCTRPIKLGGVLTVASLRELRHVGVWDKGTAETPLSSVMTKVLVSDDLVTWYELTSRFGLGAKYFRIAVYVNMLATERLSGTVIVEQERRRR
ncbi:MAG: hypothetical protein K6A96_11105 [Prevotella sp.]|nr:hypothetical protein [Prevotella sp.]